MVGLTCDSLLKNVWNPTGGNEWEKYFQNQVQTQHVWPVNMNTYMRFSIYEGLQMYVIDKIMLFSSGKIYYLFLLSFYLFTYLFKNYKY